MMVSNRNLLFQGSIFSGELLVSGRVHHSLNGICRTDGWKPVKLRVFWEHLQIPGFDHDIPLRSFFWGLEVENQTWWDMFIRYGWKGLVNAWMRVSLLACIFIVWLNGVLFFGKTQIENKLRKACIVVFKFWKSRVTTDIWSTEIETKVKQWRLHSAFCYVCIDPKMSSDVNPKVQNTPNWEHKNTLESNFTIITMVVHFPNTQGNLVACASG